MSKYKLLLGTLVVAVITFSVYLPATNNGFVTWDDDAYTYNNEHIRLLNFDSLLWAFSTFTFANWHPLTWVSYSIDYALWGLNPVGYHLTNIVFHLLNTVLVFCLVVALIQIVRKKQNPDSFRSEFSVIIAGITAGLLFGVHPLHVESVAWVSERKDVLSTFFFLLSMLAYLRYASIEERKQKHYLLALVLFILSLLSKPMAVTLPLLLIIIDWYPLRRLATTRDLRFVLLEKLPFFAFSMASSIVTLIAQKSSMPVAVMPALPVRILTALKSLMVYMLKMIWPFDLMPFYPYPADVRLFSSQYLLALVGVVGITVVSVVLAKKNRLWLAAWLSYGVMLLPVLGIVQVGLQEMADRYTYVPSISLFSLAGVGAGVLYGHSDVKHSGAVKALLACLLSGVLFLMCFSAVRQIGIWKDGITLWSHTISIIEKRPDKQYLFLNLPYEGRGLAFLERGYLDNAVDDYTKAIFHDPWSVEAYFNRGLTYAKRRDYDNAIKDFTMAIRLAPVHVEAYYSRGLSYANSGMIAEALRDYSHAIHISPLTPVPYAARGSLYASIGHDAEAARDYTHAIALQPDNAALYHRRGRIYAKLGFLQAALADYTIAIKMSSVPGYDLLRDHGIVLRRLGYEQGAERNPNAAGKNN
ncbi:MAG: tetratricopeptide repeat protein [Nitrospirota bacterium]